MTLIVSFEALIMTTAPIEIDPILAELDALKPLHSVVYGDPIEA